MVEIHTKPWTTTRVMAFNDEQTEVRMKYGGTSTGTTLVALFSKTECRQLANALTHGALVELIEAAQAVLALTSPPTSTELPKHTRLAHAVGALLR